MEHTEHTNQANSVVDKFLEAITSGEIDAVRAAYHPDAQIWHNFDQVDQTVEENLATLGWLLTVMPERRYEDIVRQPIEGGLVQQHVLRGTTSKGLPVEIVACLFVFLDQEGLIVRIEEYVDTGQSSVLRQ